jgi:hypothetical protein
LFSYGLVKYIAGPNIQKELKWEMYVCLDTRLTWLLVADWDNLPISNKTWKYFILSHIVNCCYVCRNAS